MILLLVLVQILIAVSAASPPQAPRSVEVKSGLLRWSSAEDNATYLVESRRFLEDSWSDVSQCTRTRGSSCDVSAVLQDADLGCVGLRVQAQRGLDQTEAVEACSVTEDRCTPQVNLSVSSRSIMVHLTRLHPLWKKYAHSAKHWVCSWSLDQPKAVCKETLSSLSLPLTDQDPGRTYCVTVQYRLYNRLRVGLPHCPVCIEVPQVQFKHMGVVLGTVLPCLLLILGSGMAYVLIFHKKRIKKWFRPKPEPDCLTLPLEGAPVWTPSEEHCDIITEFREISQD